MLTLLDEFVRVLALTAGRVQFGFAIRCVGAGNMHWRWLDLLQLESTCVAGVASRVVGHSGGK